MRLLLAAKIAHAHTEEALWLAARNALDHGERWEDVAAVLEIHSRASLYRQLADRGLTYGRGAVLRAED